MPALTPSNATSASNPRRLSWTVLGGLLVTVLTLGLLYILVDVEALRDQLRQAQLGYLALGLLVIYPLAMLGRGLRWWWLLGQHLSWPESLHTINVSYMANMIFPARLGEVVRLVLVGNLPQGDAGRAISGLAVERLLDVLFALLTIAIGLVLLGQEATLPTQVSTSLSIFIVAVMLGFGVLFLTPPLHPLLVRYAARLLRRVWPGQAGPFARLLIRTLRGMRQLAHPRILLAVFGWSALTWGLYAAFYHTVLAAFSPAPDPGASILATGFIALSISVPSVPSYAGPFHVGAALALSMYGYHDALAASFALSAHALVTLLTIAVGLYSMQALHTSFGALRQMIQRRSDSPGEHVDEGQAP